MKKVLFTTMSIIAVAAMMLVSCKKDNGVDNKDKDNKPVDEYTGPVEGTSAWSVVGTLLESDWGGGAHGDYVMAEASEGIFVLKNVKLIATDAFKFRENKGWANAYKGEFVTLGEAFDIDNTPGEINIVPALEGIYDIYMNLTVEQAAIVEKDGAEPTWKEVVPAPVTIDGDMSDWESIEGITAGSNTLKAISDANNIYLYSKRANTGRYNDIWGGTGYVYFGFDLDNNSETGDGEKADWGTGKWETLILTYPYAGTADAKAMATEMNSDWWVLPSTFTIANLKFKGAVEEDGAAFEVCIPRSDIAAVPTTQITIKSWGNKDLSTAVLECTL